MAEVGKIKKVVINKLIPYEKNAKKHSEKQLEKLSASIKEFGFISPVLIDKDYNIIAGHGRVEAARLSGLEDIPCVFVEGLTEAQRKAYIIADNRLSEFGEWDIEAVQSELADISDYELDFNIGELEFPEPSLKDAGGYYGDERERTNDAYNLGIAHDTELSVDFWQMPIIKNDNYTPERLLGFNYAKSSKDKACGVHFFIDDYQFERVWNYPEKYIDILKQYECILSPDFSLYMDMPMPMKIWNVYRSRQIGAYYQSQGIKVIPTISWAEESTYCFCFEGIPHNSIVAISTVGVLKNKDSQTIFKNGVDRMLEIIEPSKIILYGGGVDHDFQGIETVNFQNEVTERWK